MKQWGPLGHLDIQVIWDIFGFFADMGTIIPTFGSLNTIDKVKTILCPATNQAAKLTNRFIGTMFKERENIDNGVYLQVDQGNVSDSDEAFQSESSEDEI